MCQQVTAALLGIILMIVSWFLYGNSNNKMQGKGEECLSVGGKRPSTTSQQPRKQERIFTAYILRRKNILTRYAQ